MFKLKRAMGVGFVVLSLLVGSGPLIKLEASEDKPLAKVGDQVLTNEDVAIVVEADPQLRELLRQRPELMDQVKNLVVERWINLTLLYLYAKEKGLDRDPEVRKKLAEIEKYVLAEEVLQREFAGIKPTEEELKEFYQKNKELYREPEGVKVKHILIYVPEKADKKTRDEALAKAKKIRERIKRGERFEDLARKYSDDTASREKGGDLGVLRRGMTVPEFEDKVFALEEGKVSEPIASPYGYHIVKLEKRIPAKTKAFEEVKNQVADDYLKEKERERLSRLMSELKKKYQPEVYLRGEKDASQ